MSNDRFPPRSSGNGQSLNDPIADVRSIWNAIAVTNADNQWSVSNPGPSTLLVWLEPWAEEFDVPPRSTLTMRPPNGDLLGEIECAPDHLVVWASARTVEVFIDGALQHSGSATIPVPDGLTKEMLNVLFANQAAARLGGANLDVTNRISLWRRILRWLRF